MPRNHPFVEALFDAFDIKDPEKKLTQAKAAIAGIKRYRKLCLKEEYREIFSEFKRELGEAPASLAECEASLPSIDSVDCRKNTNYSPLIEAVVRQDYSMFKLILDSEADVNFKVYVEAGIDRDWIQRGPLMFAIMHRHANTQMIKDLFAKGATYNQDEKVFCSVRGTEHSGLFRGEWVRIILDEHESSRQCFELGVEIEKKGDLKRALSYYESAARFSTCYFKAPIKCKELTARLKQQEVAVAPAPRPSFLRFSKPWQKPAVVSSSVIRKGMPAASC